MKSALGLLFSLAFVHVPAQAQQHAISGKAGLLGLGFEYSYSFTERVAVRGMLYGSGYSFGAEESGIDYDFDLDWDSLSVAVDVHPASGPFRLSAGLMSNDNGLSARSTPVESITIGDTSYAPGQIGSLDGRIGFDGTSPFIGLGWDWSKTRRFAFALDLGIVSQGSPVVSLSATSPLQDLPDFAADLRAEEAELRESLDDLDVLPFATLGMTFRF